MSIVRVAAAPRRLATAAAAGFGGALFALAGVLMVLAARLRWADACRAGFDSQQCVTAQDHRYDFVLPTEPWAPIPGAAELAGFSYLVSAVGMVLLFAGLRSPIWARAIQPVLVLVLVVVGAVTLLSGLVGEPVGQFAAVSPWLQLLWGFAFPVALAYVVVGGVLETASSDAVVPRAAWTVWLLALCLSTPLAGYFVGALAMGYSSHDTTPWNEAVTGVLLIIAGAAVLIGAVWNGLSRRVRSAAPHAR